MDAIGVIISPWYPFWGISVQLLWNANPPVGFWPGTSFQVEGSNLAERVRASEASHSDSGMAQLFDVTASPKLGSPPLVFPYEGEPDL